MFHKYDSNRGTEELKALWTGKSKYVDIVLSKIRIFKVGNKFNEDITDKIH
jgi:hypothetical protein